jgi:hypothetical protein
MVVRLLSVLSDDPLIPFIAGLHAGCITYDGAIAAFLPPLDDDKRDKLLAWWRRAIGEVGNKTRLIVLLFRGDEPADEDAGERLIGVATLSMPSSETEPMCAKVEDLFVSYTLRRMGCATIIMKEVEKKAWKVGRTLLVSTTPLTHSLSY